MAHTCDECLKHWCEIGMYIDVCTDGYMCTYMCTDMCVGTHLDMCMNMCVDIDTDMCMDMCMDMSLDIRIAMCIGWLKWRFVLSDRPWIRGTNGWLVGWG